VKEDEQESDTDLKERHDVTAETQQFIEKVWPGLCPSESVPYDVVGIGTQATCCAKFYFSSVQNRPFRTKVRPF